MTGGARSLKQCGVVLPFRSARLEPPRPSEAGPAAAPRFSRRLSDKILIAFHTACDQGELGIAGALLQCCETAMERRAADGRERRANDERLIAAFERLWFLRQPEDPDRPRE